MNSNLKGNIGEAKALNYFISNGYEVYLPFGTATKCDLIVLKDNITYRVSVKTTSSLNSSGSYNVRISQGKMKDDTPLDKEASDILFVHIIPEDRNVVLQTKDIKAQFRLCVK